MADDRRMTFIIVPHGGQDLSTRSFEVSYRRLRVVGILLVVAVGLWIATVASWAFFFSQAARVPGLKQEVARLEKEQVRMGQLAASLRRLEAEYEKVRRMLGADRPHDPESLWIPPPEGAQQERGSGADSGQVSLPSAWPLTRPGFITREHLGRIPGQHPGIDIAVAEGSYVRAAGAGVVDAAGRDSIYGEYVRLRHPGGTSPSTGTPRSASSRAGTRWSATR